MAHRDCGVSRQSGPETTPSSVLLPRKPAPEGLAGPNRRLARDSQSRAWQRRYRPKAAVIDRGPKTTKEINMDMLEPGRFGYAVNFKKRYGNYIGGQWVPPVNGQYFENITPITGRAFCEIPRSTAEDIERALDAAHAPKSGGGRASPPTRANTLKKIADRMEQTLDLRPTAETWDNGKPIRETMAADIPLAIDHFRYFAG